ncbi:BatA domain-containing protein [Lysobacter sp. TAB13]|uniref:BatA domain-containing protein n=1 Tax=Lysobacter sp. TAB13 TaxID=3233065 RepID=UPI003F9D0E4B
MTPVLLLPIGLAALAALAIPLLIHLARRSEQRPTDFAALRWLRQKPKPRHRIRFDEWLLLALRLLLLAALALLLARPALFGAHSDRPWAVVVPGVDAKAAAAQAGSKEVEWHWLAPGFPSLDRPAPTSPQPVASLLRELDATLPAEVALTVYAPRRLTGADGSRPQLSRPLQWRIIDGAATDVPAPTPPRSSPTQIRYAADRAAALPYLRAAIAAGADANAAGDPASASIAPIEQTFDPQGRSLIWLAPGPVPAAVSAWVEQGGSVLIDADSRWPGAALRFDAPVWRDGDGTLRIEGASFGRGRVLRLTGPLSPRAWPQMLQPGFAQRWLAVFEPAAAQPARVLAQDYTPSAGGPSFARPPLDLRPWLALLIAVLFLIERWFATGRRRGAAP